MKKLIALILFIAPFIAQAQVTGLELPYGVKVLDTLATDAWYGPYESIEHANENVPEPVRKNRTVKIGTQEYWWRDGNSDEDLILKSSAPAQTTVPWDSVTNKPDQLGFHYQSSLDNWILRDVPDNAWESVTYGNGIFVAVSSTGTGNRVMTSEDGVTWEAQTSAANTDWKDVVYGNGIFVAVGSDNDGTDNVMTSTDGETWTIQEGISGGAFETVAYGNGVFVALGSNEGTQLCMTSSDGETWTSQSLPSYEYTSWTDIAFGDGRFVAVAQYGNPSPPSDIIMYSTNGTSWTTVGDETLNQNQWWSITYGNGKFVAGGSSFNGTITQVGVSDDGTSWAINQFEDMHTYPIGIAYGDGLFAIATGIHYTEEKDGQIWTSNDGITWTKREELEDHFWTGITYGKGIFVAVGNGFYEGTNGAISNSAIVTAEPIIEQYHEQWRDSVGTVKSVAITMPTGFTVNGSPITESGTLAITTQAGYFLPSFFTFDSLVSVNRMMDSIYNAIDTLSSGGSTNATAIRGKTVHTDAASPSDGDILVYRSSGDAWVLEEKPSGGGGSPDWGDIGGTLSDQTDLKNALDAKADLAGATFTGLVTFTPDETNSGLNIGSVSSNPSSLSNGDVWYNSASNYIGARVGGNTRQLITSATSDVSTAFRMIIAAGQGRITQTGSEFNYTSSVLNVPGINVSTSAELPSMATLGGTAFSTLFAAKANITPTAATGTSVAFDTNRSYCTDASPCTGNITYNSSGAVVGQIATMVHNDSSEPTFGTEFIILSGEYAPNENNYIMFFLRESGIVWVTISQEQ